VLAILGAFVRVAFAGLGGRRTFFAPLATLENLTGVCLFAGTTGFVAGGPGAPGSNLACHWAFFLLASTRFLDVRAWFATARGFYPDDASASLLAPAAGLGARGPAHEFRCFTVDRAHLSVALTSLVQNRARLAAFLVV